MARGSTRDLTPRGSTVALPTRHDLSANLNKLAKLTPERVAEILRKAETGDVADLMDLCDRMFTTDGHIRATYETRLAAIAGAAWVVEPGASGDPVRDAQAEPAARFVSRVLEAMRGASDDGTQDIMRVGFSHAVTRALDAIGKSFSTLEIPWELDEETGAFVPRSLIWVHQRRFRWDAATWKLRLIDDGVARSYPGQELQPRRWIIHCPPAAGAYPWVSGVLRTVAWCYLFKRWTRQFWVTGAESFSWPFVFAKVPRGATKEVRSEALSGLEQLSADHRAVIEDPVAFEILESAAKDAGTWKALEENLDREISKAILGSTDSTEPSKVGAYGAVESRRGTTVEPRLATDERNLAEDFERQLFDPLIDFNLHLFGGVRPPTPCIRWTIAAKRREIPDVVVASGVVTVDELRASAGLEPLGGAAGARFIAPSSGAMPGGTPPAPSVPSAA